MSENPEIIVHETADGWAQVQLRALLGSLSMGSGNRSRVGLPPCPSVREVMPVRGRVASQPDYVSTQDVSSGNQNIN